MTALAVFLGCVALGCVALLVHPLLRFLKVSEVPAALLACAAGRLNRRRLLFILRSRRQVCLEGTACLPPGPLARPPHEKTPAAPRAAHVAKALEARPGSVSVRGIGPRQAEVTVVFRRPVVSFAEALGDDWRDSLPVARNPWAHLVNAELAEHRARLEQDREDIR